MVTNRFLIGEHPYSDQVESKEVIHFLELGGRLGQPDGCSTEM